MLLPGDDLDENVSGSMIRTLPHSVDLSDIVKRAAHFGQAGIEPDAPKLRVLLCKHYLPYKFKTDPTVYPLLNSVIRD